MQRLAKPSGRESSAGSIPAPSARQWECRKCRAFAARPYEHPTLGLVCPVCLSTVRPAKTAEEKRSRRKAHKERRRNPITRTPDPSMVPVLKRDPCSYCGGPGGTLDHIEPKSAGGPGGWENMTGACSPCNQRKGSRSLLTALRMFS